MTTIKQENPEDVIKHDNDTTNPDLKKSSMEILSELFSTFDAEPPIIVKKEKKDKSEESHRKNKKSKKKHKHKEKKHKKKSKKRRRSSSSSSLSSNHSEVDLANILIKEEQGKVDKQIKIEGVAFSLDITNYLGKNLKEKKSEVKEENNVSCHSKKKYKIENNEISHYISSKDFYYKERHRTSKRHRSSSRDKDSNKEKYIKYDDLRHKVKKSSSSDHKRHSHERESHRSEDRYKHRERYTEHQDRNIEDHEVKSKFREKESRISKDEEFYRHRDERSKESDKVTKSDKWFMRERYRGYSNDRSVDRYRSRSREPEDSSSRIDKKKLLEIARRNAIQMMKSGSLPGALNLGSRAQEKMIAAIKSGGKTIEELTDFCKSLSKKEQLGELSSLSEKEDSDTDEPFHHPFLIKDRPTSITMNIKNSVPLPTKTTQERTTELRMQFPVSSGQQHRVNEEWVPVSPPNSKKTNAEPAKTVSEVAVIPLNRPVSPIPIEVPLPPPPSLTPEIANEMTAPPNTLPGPQVFPASASSPNTQSQVDIGSIVSQRLTAMRKLQENPHDSQALSEIYKSNKEVQSWAKSKQQLGQFTGTTGANILSAAELTSGYQAWAKKDQLQTAAPVSGGMGMHLLQKMGWKPGEGLGKEKTGTLEPLLLEVKLDKKGLVANEEQSKGNKKKSKQVTVKTLQGKHPVSLLGEYASKKKLGAPQYILEFECGPDHKKNFLFKVILNGVEYKPNIVSASKKEAKANAASVALQQIGLLP